MSGIRRYPLMLAAAAVCVLLLLGGGQAFFPKAQEVAEDLKAEFKGLESWRVELALNGTSDHRIRCWRKGDLWRQEWFGPRDNSTRVLRAALGKGQRIDAVHPSSANIPYPPLRLAWLAAPEKEWERLAINDEVKSYQFLGDRPCIVLGAKQGDMRSSQIWIDLERHVPLRLVAPSGITWRWSKYYSLGNHLLPTRQRIAFPQGKRFHFDLKWHKVGTEISESRFSPENFSRELADSGNPEVEEPRIRFLLDNLPPGKESPIEWGF